MNGQTVEFPKTELLTRLALSDSGFVFDPVTGNSFTVNATGLTILRHLQKEVELEEMVGMLLDEYEVDDQVAKRDVIEFAASLRSAFK